MAYVRRLTWDRWNVPHILRHGVSPDEVEEVCNGEHVVRETYQGRLILIGPTFARRMLAVVLEPETGEGDVYYPVTAAARQSQGTPDLPGGEGRYLR